MEAIQTRNEMLLRGLLSSPANCFIDTFWAPVPQYFTRLYRLNYTGVHFDFKLIGKSSLSEPTGGLSVRICAHERIDSQMQQPLEVGHLGKVAVNVLAMAMIFSTPDFNALQLCIESGRFTLSETMIFHEVNSGWDNYKKLNFGSNSLTSFDIVELNNGQKRALLSFGIRAIDPLFFAIAIDSLRRDKDPLLTRSLLNSGAVDCSAKVCVVDIEELTAVSRVLSNPLVFNPTHFAYCEPFNRINI